MGRTARWIEIEEVLREAGSRADPAEQAQVLKQAGAEITRNSRAQWIANPADPRVRQWMRDVAEMARSGD